MLSISRISTILGGILKDKDFIQKTVFLMGSTVLGLFLGFLSNSLLTRVLGKEQYGNYALIINIFSFCQILFNFGVFYSISRLVAISSDNIRTRGYYYVGAILSFLLFVIMAIALLVYGYLSSSIVKNNLLNVFLISIPFSWLYLFTNLNENFLPGDNKINLLSLSRILPKFIFTLILIYIYYISKTTNLTSVIIFNYVSLALSYIYVYWKIKPVRENFKRRTSEIFIANKQFGFDIYFGSLIASGSGSLSGILISHFGVNNIEVGYYTLATLLASPLALIPNIIATVQFKKFATSERIDRSSTMLTIGISLCIFLFIVLGSNLIIGLIFGKDYVNSIEILKYLSVGYLLYGIGDYFNRFLLAKGKGKELRNASFFVGITLLLANIVFIKYLGGKGAAIARIASGLMYTLVILFYYKKEIKVK